MFSSLQFLFLVSLGVFTWVILCYVKQIEEYLTCPRNSSEQQSTPVILQPKKGQSTEQAHPMTACRDYTDFYVHFICILVCIYALAKIIHMAECYVARVMYGKLAARPVIMNSLVSGEYEQTPQEASEVHHCHMEQLEKQNLELKLKLHEARNAKCAKNSKGIEGSDNKAHIYVTNRHYSVNHNLYMDTLETKTLFKNMSDEAQDKNNIWIKYLQMQKLTLKRPTTLCLSSQKETFGPVVLSAEELQKL